MVSGEDRVFALVSLEAQYFPSVTQQFAFKITEISTVTIRRIQGLARPATISNRVAPHLIALRRKSAARSSPVTIVSYPLSHQDRTVVPAKMGIKTRFIRLQTRAKTAGE